MSTKKFTCPYCNKPTTATDPHIFEEEVKVGLENHSSLGEVFLVVEAISCPNPDCNNLYLNISLANKKWSQPIQRYKYTVLHEWQLLPESQAKVLPGYIPQSIQQDYYESCRIRDLSPKASATLARRCLQGMIRDFWGISRDRLKDEVDEIEEKVDPAVWESIDAVRSVGNIGAHMEKDINIIIDVDPKEAQLLIGLIEQLIDDWYVARENRRKRTEELKNLAISKETKKNQIENNDTKS
jgi:hypothetical protein